MKERGRVLGSEWEVMGCYDLAMVCYQGTTDMFGSDMCWREIV